MLRNALVNVCVAVVVACVAVLLVASVVNAQSPHPKSSQTVTPAVPRTADLSAPHVIATVQFPLGLIEYAYIVAVNPKTGLLYVGGATGLSIADDTQVITNLAVSASAIVVNPTTGYVYVGRAGEIDVVSGTEVIATLPLNISAYQVLGVNPTTGLIYVGDRSSGSMTILSATQVVTSFQLGAHPNSLSVDPKSGYVYVPDTTGSNIAILSGTSIITRVTVGFGPNKIVTNPGTGLTYVSMADGPILVLSNTTVLTALQFWSIGALATDPTTGYVYVMGDHGGPLTIISGTEEVTRVPIYGDYCDPIDCYWIGAHLAVNPATGHVYVSSDWLPMKIVSGTKVVAELGELTGQLAINPNNGRVYVRGNNNVAILYQTEIMGRIWNGFAPVMVSANPLTTDVYVASAAGEIKVMQGQQLVGSAEVGGVNLPVNVGFDPNNGLTYVPQLSPRSLTVMRGSQIVDSIPLNIRPHLARVQPLSGDIYVAGDPPDAFPKEMVEIMSGYQVQATIELLPDTYPQRFVSDIDFNPATGYGYIATSSDYSPYPEQQPHGKVYVISNTTVVASPTIGLYPREMAVNPATGYLYVANSGSNNVSVLSGMDVITALPALAPTMIGVNPISGYAYAIGEGHPQVTIVSGTQVITTLVLPADISAIAVNPVSGYVYVTQPASNTVTVITGTEVVADIPVDGEPCSISAQPNTGLVYVANELGQNVSILQDLIIPRGLTPGSLVTPYDDLMIGFSGAVETNTIGITISPTVPLTLTWSADGVTIEHGAFEVGIQYVVSIGAGGRSVSGLVVVPKSFVFVYFPYRHFVPWFVVLDH